MQTFKVGPVSSASNRKSIYSNNGSIISYNSCNHNKAFEVDLAKKETFDAVANATEKSSKKLSIEKNTNFNGIMLKIMFLYDETRYSTQFILNCCCCCCC